MKSLRTAALLLATVVSATRAAAQTDHLTELFAVGTRDTAGATWTFTPTDDPLFHGYAPCTIPTAVFPTPPGGTVMTWPSGPGGDDGFQQIDLVDGAVFPFYATDYSAIFVGANGYITFGAGDTAFAASAANHFALPRISILFDDLLPLAGGTVTAQQFPDRIVVTYVDVPRFDSAQPNHFQAELFFDGSVTITHLVLADDTAGTTGLSDGNGIPAGFASSDFALYPQCFTASVPDFALYE